MSIFQCFIIKNRVDLTYEHLTEKKSLFKKKMSMDD